MVWKQQQFVNHWGTSKLFKKKARITPTSIAINCAYDEKFLLIKNVKTHKKSETDRAHGTQVSKLTKP